MMIFFPPGRLRAVQILKQLSAAQFCARGLHEKSTAAARTDESVDLTDEVFRKKNVYSLCAHIMPTNNVT